MSKISVALFILFVAFSGNADPNVTLTGNTTDCFQDSLIHIPQVNVSAFDASLNREMVDSLRAIDALNFTDSAETAMSRMDIQLNRIHQLADSSTALGRGTSDANGSFEFSFAPVDSVLVFGWYDSEEDPFSFSYKVIGGQGNTSLALDMSRGRCNYVTQQ